MISYKRLYFIYFLNLNLFSTDSIKIQIFYKQEIYTGESSQTHSYPFNSDQSNLLSLRFGIQIILSFLNDLIQLRQLSRWYNLNHLSIEGILFRLHLLHWRLKILNLIHWHQWTLIIVIILLLPKLRIFIALVTQIKIIIILILVIVVVLGLFLLALLDVDLVNSFLCVFLDQLD